MLAACRQRGLSSDESAGLFEPVYAAMEEVLPVECLYERIDEGLAKKADLERIDAAVRHRLECLRQARRLLSEVQTGRPGGGPLMGPPHLLPNLGMALESGVSPELLKSVFLRPGRLRYGRLAHVVEAAEALHLAGLEDDQVRRIMGDFLDRDMNRSEMIRVVGLLQQGLAQGRAFDPLYASIWGDAPKTKD